MKMQNMFKKVVVSGLALSMIAGGSTAAFADGKGKGHDKEDKWQKQFQNGNHNEGNHDDDLNLNVHIRFDDVRGSDVEWALKNIARLASLRVFDGYEDGTFQPRKAISRIEAITAAVRLMGLRDKAESQAEMSTQLNFQDAAKIAQKYPWAVGYVAVAAENDLFLESDDAVQPEKEADRLWSTILLVKALKLDAEAKEKINTKLPFRDADKIPAGSVGYVAVAMEKGLINGYEDNTFRPNKPVTRAELAALLDRTGTQMPDYNNQMRSGTISAINGNTITLTSNGQSTQLTLHPNALIFRNGTVATASSLAVGDQIRVNFYNNQVIFLEVTQPTQNNNQAETGTISAINGNAITMTSNGQNVQLTLASNAVIIRNGTSVNASALVVGDQIRVTYYNNQVVYLQVIQPNQTPDTNNQANGTISAISGSTITMTDSSGHNTQLTLAANAVIIRGGTTVNASALKIGDQIRVNYYNNQVIFLEVVETVEENDNYLVSGKFSSMTLNANGEIATVSVTTDVYNSTQTSVYNVASNVTIVGNAALLIPNQNVQLTVRNQVVKQIEIK